MFRIGITKKLQDELNKEIESFSGEMDAINMWMGNVFKVSRYKCVIFINVETRYSVVLFRLRKKDFENIHVLFREQLISNLKDDGLKETVINQYVKSTENIVYTNTFSRSILGSIKECIYFAETIFAEIGIENPDMSYLNHFLNTMIHMPLGPHYPVNLMKDKLEYLYT